MTEGQESDTMTEIGQKDRNRREGQEQEMPRGKDRSGTGEKDRTGTGEKDRNRKCQ